MDQLPYGIRTEREGDMVRFTGSNPKAWETFTLVQTGYAIKSFVEEHNQIGPLPQIDFRIGHGRVDEFLREMYRLEQRLESLPDEASFAGSYMGRRRGLFSRLTQEIKSRRQYDLVPQMVHSISGNEMPSTLKRLFYLDITALYMLVCSPPKYLVGTKGGVFWKELDLGFYGEGGKQGNAYDIVGPYLTHLHLIGRRELVTVPTRVMFQEDITNVHLPNPSAQVEESLEDAYYRQRYVVPPEGAEVRFRKADDLRSLVMVQSGENLLSKVVTDRGDGFVWINLNTASVVAPDLYLTFGELLTPKGAWGRIVADTYHDLVTAIEISTTSYRTVRTQRRNVIEEVVDIEDQPQIIYIPRIVKAGMPDEPRIPYEGPARPIKPHKVSGYKRRGDMTVRHESELQRWSELTGLSVPNVPEGYTWVRPYVTPRGVELTFRQLPQFIKRKIESQLS